MIEYKTLHFRREISNLGFPYPHNPNVCQIYTFSLNLCCQLKKLGELDQIRVFGLRDPGANNTYH